MRPLQKEGFILTMLLSRYGMYFSPAYDVNPNEYGMGLHLNISEDDNALELLLALYRCCQQSGRALR